MSRYDGKQSQQRTSGGPKVEDIFEMIKRKRAPEYQTQAAPEGGESGMLDALMAGGQAYMGAQGGAEGADMKGAEVVAQAPGIEGKDAVPGVVQQGGEVYQAPPSTSSNGKDVSSFLDPKYVKENKPEAKAMLAEKAGVETSAINEKNIQAVNQAARGSLVVAEAGKDPTKVDFMELKKAGAEADGEKVKKTSEEDLGNQQKMATILLALIPTIAGSLFGGDTGLQRGAEAGALGVQTLVGMEKEEKDRLSAKQEKDLDRAAKEKGYDLQLQQLKSSERHQQTMEDLQRQSQSTARTKADRDYEIENKKISAAAQKTQGGRPMTDSAAEKLGVTNFSLAELDALEQTILNNKQNIGPIEGFKRFQPYNETQKDLNSQFQRVAQNVGKALEGGKMTDKDREFYQQINAGVNQTPEQALKALQNLRSSLRSKMNSDVTTLGKAGFDVSQFGDSLQAQQPQTPPPPPPDTITQDGHVYKRNPKTGEYE